MSSTQRPFWLSSYLVAGLLLFAAPALSQSVVPDGTLSTKVTTPDNLNFTITNGDRVGTNLFHSFSQFSVPTGGSAFFNNAVDVQNIISRVTGGNLSTIDGLIQSNGTANLFLMNPSGISFGPNARLQLGGSFFATTANSIKFADGTEFSATNPQASPLLTVSVPIGLQFGANPGGITVQGQPSPSTIQASSLAPVFGQGPQPVIVAWQQLRTAIDANTAGLAVSAGQTLALIGGPLDLSGATLKVNGGNIELGSVGSNSIINLLSDAQGFKFSYGSVQNFQDIQIHHQSLVDASGQRSSRLRVQGRNVTLDDRTILLSSTLGTEAGRDLSIQASSLLVDRGSLVATGTYTSAASGNIAITVNDLIIQGDSVLSTLTLNQGRAGALTIQATGSADIGGGSLAFTGAIGETGSGNDVSITAESLVVREGAQVSSTNFSLNRSGNINVTAAKYVLLTGTTPNGSASSLLSSNTFGGGDAGILTLTTPRLSLQQGGGIVAGSFSRARGGDIIITATDAVEVTGTAVVNTNPSGIFANSFGSGASGSLTIFTSNLTVQDGAQIGTSSFGSGKGGNIDLVVIGQLNLVGSADPQKSDITLTAATGEDAPFLPFFKIIFTPDSFSPLGLEGTGAGGNLRISSNQVLLRDGAIVTVSSNGSGVAGELDIRARVLQLDNQSSLRATTAAGQGGNINLQLRDFLLLREQSQITATAGSTGDGGNITLNTPFIVAVANENSDIIANAVRGRGGNIQITSNSIFGITPRPQLTPQSDITASSQFGIDGTTNLTILSLTPTTGVETLPTALIDPNQQIAQGCSQIGDSRFVVTGRGGLPENPTERSNSRLIWADTREFSPGFPNTSVTTAPQAFQPEAVPEMVEATGWRQTGAGEIELYATVPREVKPKRIASCPVTKPSNKASFKS